MKTALDILKFSDSSPKLCGLGKIPTCAASVSGWGTTAERAEIGECLKALGLLHRSGCRLFMPESLRYVAVATLRAAVFLRARRAAWRKALAAYGEPKRHDTSFNLFRHRWSKAASGEMAKIRDAGFLPETEGCYAFIDRSGNRVSWHASRSSWRYAFAADNGRWIVQTREGIDRLFEKVRETTNVHSSPTHP